MFLLATALEVVVDSATWVSRALFACADARIQVRMCIARYMSTPAGIFPPGCVLSTPRTKNEVYLESASLIVAVASVAASATVTCPPLYELIISFTARLISGSVRRPTSQ